MIRQLLKMIDLCLQLVNKLVSSDLFIVLVWAIIVVAITYCMGLIFGHTIDFSIFNHDFSVIG